MYGAAMSDEQARNKVTRHASGDQPGAGPEQEPGYARDPESAPSFAGLPGRLTAAAMHKERDYVTFVIPKDEVGVLWARSGRSDCDLEIAVIEATPDMEDRASAAAGMRQDFSASYRELMISTIYMIGGEHTRGNRGKIQDWLRDIGPRARKLVERAFNAMNTIEESTAESFLDSARPGHG